MSVEQLESQLLALPEAERRRFLDWCFAHESELVEKTPAPIEQAWREETRRRIAEIESNTVRGVPGEEVSEKIRRLVVR